MIRLLGLALLLSLLSHGYADDTVADDVGIHMIQRISVLLAPEECQDFHTRLINPDMNVDEELEKLDPENNILTRRKRELVTREQCYAILEEWLEKEGDTMYWDRLCRTLRMIGRDDVARELGKNLNQDKNLELKRNVQDYNKNSLHQKSSLLMNEKEKREASRRVRDLNEDDWNLIFEAEKVPRYDRSMTEWFKPVLHGIIFGFVGSAVLATLLAYFTVWLSNSGRIAITRIERVSNFPDTPRLHNYSSSEDSEDCEQQR